jgi:hypothetical protein
MRLSTASRRDCSVVVVPRVVQFVEDVAQDRLGIDGAEDRGGFTHGEGAGAEGFDDEAERLQFLRHLQQRSASDPSVTISGDQQRLPRHAGLVPLRFRRS